MSTQDASVRRHIVIGAEKLSVGGLSPAQLGKNVKVWTKDELGKKKQAGFPREFFYIHLVAGSVPTKMATDLRHDAHGLNPQPTVYDPADEQVIEVRLRAFLGLPALVMPAVSSVLNPVGHFRQEALAALALAAEAEAERGRFEDELNALKERQQRLDSRAEAALSAEFRHLAVILRLRARLRSTSLALSMSTGRVEVRIPPERFDEDWQSQCQALANAEVTVRSLREQLAKKTGSKSARPDLSDKVKSLEGQVADLGKLLEERASTIRALHEQCDALEAEATSAIAALAKTPKPKSKPKLKPKRRQ
jgi:hypothetical protein